MHIFKVGDWVYAGVDQWCYGQIIAFDGAQNDIAVVEFGTDYEGGTMSFDLEDLKPAEPPKKSKINHLPDYHFDRDEMTKAFFEVFSTDEYTDICVECGFNRHLESFSLFRCDDEFYILHRPSGIMINWYKHMGRTNTCNRPDFTLDALREFLQKLREDLVWERIIDDEALRRNLYKRYYGEE